MLKDAKNKKEVSLKKDELSQAHLNTRREFLKKSGLVAGVATVAVTTGVVPKAYAVEKTTRWGMVIDLCRCIGCKACAVACKTEFDTRLGVFRSNVIEYDSGTYPKAKRSFLPWLCNHCEKPLCIRDCPVEPIDAEYDGIEYQKRATYRRPDGAVLVDQDRCIACGLCVRLCPYNVRYLDPVTSKADKCDFCMHRVEKGVVPSCVNTCQGNARIFGDLNDPDSEASKLVKDNKVDVLVPSAKTEPHVYYIGLDEYAYAKGYDIRDEVKHGKQRKIWQGGEGYKAGQSKGGNE